MNALRPVADWIKAHRWWVAFVAVLIAGYSVGKDAALRDNAREAVQANAGMVG